jgi:hypothetical protein
MRPLCMPRAVTVLLLLSLLPPAAHPTRAQDEAAPAITEVVLVDGTRLRGRLVSETATRIVLETDSGPVQVERERIRSVTYHVESEPPAPRWRDDPDANSLLLVPTARTLPKGDVYYRNFVLLFNNLGYAVTDAFDISAMAAFPVTSDVRIICLGAKLRLVSADQAGIGIAVNASTWIVDEEHLSTVGGIVSVGNRQRSLTAALNYGIAEDENEAFVLLGGDLQVGRGVKLLAEYGNSQSALTEDHDFNGIINVGFRLFWEQTSFTLTGFRPLEETGDFLAFPLAMFSAHF